MLAAQAPATDSRIQRDTLDNGMLIIVVENHAVPLATAHVVLRGGAITQTPELQGVPHLFEHMLFKSYKQSNGVSFDSDASMTGAAFNGATGDEAVSYTMWLPSGKLGDCVQMLADLVRDPNFVDDDLRTERFVVRNELQRSQSSPERQLAVAVEEELWGSWYPRKNTIGNEMALFAVNPSVLKEMYRQWYVPNNAALIVTGDVKAEKVFSEARKHFGRWRRAPNPFVRTPVPAPPPFDSTRAIVYTHPVQTVTVQMSWRGPALSTDSAGTLDAEAFVNLVNAEDSRLQQLLIDSGNFQSAYFTHSTYRYGSELTFRGVTTLESLLPALGLLGTEVGRMSDADYFTPESITAAAMRRKVGRVLAAEESASFASTIGDMWATAGLDFFMQQDAAIGARTPSTIRAFVDRYMGKKPYIIGVLTPEGTEQATANTLLQFINFMKDQ